MVRRKEDDEEVKMVCLVVATVVQMVVEMVVKFMERMGSLMFLGEKRLKKVVWRCFCWWKWRRRWRGEGWRK